MAAAPAKHNNRPTSNAKLLEKFIDLETRVEALESMVNAAKLRQQQEIAAKLAANPSQLAELQSLLQLAQQAKGQ